MLQLVKKGCGLAGKEVPHNIQICFPCQQLWEDDLGRSNLCQSVYEVWMPNFTPAPNFSVLTVK